MTGATVPVVEIEAVLLNALAYNLSGEGLRVLKAADGEQGLRLLRAEIDIPILMLSARGEEQDRVYGLEVGADDYVVKSFVLRELIARARAGLRRRAVPAQPRAVLSAVR